MKSLLRLWNELANESASRCCTSATHDIKTVMARTEHEGLSFLTITLPEFGKAVEKCLDQKQVCPHQFEGFKVNHRTGGLLPLFLGGYLGRVFDTHSGALLDEPCVDSILALRQLTLMFGKISMKCTSARTRKAMRGYIECEKDVREFDRTVSPELLERFRLMSNMLYSRVFSEVDHKIYNLELLPKHGPGVTADGLLGNQKFNQRTWTSRLESVLPAGEYLLPNWRYLDQFAEIDILEPDAETPVKVVSVPKTLKAPRIIGIEPTAMQYAQQAILPEILHGLGQDNNLVHMLGFSDQTPNQEMARDGSTNGTLATLDLSEASDRVSNKLIRTMCQNWPHLDKAVQASRSEKARVPGHGIQSLTKFASMGSALCFPFEAMVFLTVVLLGIEQSRNAPLSLREINTLKDTVRIYGDDIIVPVDHVESVVGLLNAFGARVNQHKSFWNGKFRESCGREFYAGSDVSIVRVRHLLPTRRSDATGVISMVSLRNQLYHAGYWKTCQWLDDKIRNLIRHFPVVLPTSPVLGRHSFLGYESRGLDEFLHSPFVKGYVVSARIPSNKLDGPGALLKFLLKRGGMPSVDSNHLERSGRPVAVNIKLRKASAV
jgi:hypothetical protein